MNKLPLKALTPTSWVSNVIDDFSLFLYDHASCERKASALALSMVMKYSNKQKIIEPMISLAREELEHFQQVIRIIHKRGLKLALRDEKDLYVNNMLKKLRHGQEEHFLDRLILSGLIEARGHERFALLAKHLEDETLKKFYQQLSEKEAAHYLIFFKLASSYFDKKTVEEAIKNISELESEVMLSTPHTFRLH